MTSPHLEWAIACVTFLGIVKEYNKEAKEIYEENN